VIPLQTRSLSTHPAAKPRWNWVCDVSRQILARLVSVAKLENALGVRVPVPEGRRIVAQGEAERRQPRSGTLGIQKNRTVFWAVSERLLSRSELVIPSFFRRSETQALCRTKGKSEFHSQACHLCRAASGIFAHLCCGLVVQGNCRKNVQISCNRFSRQPVLPVSSICWSGR